MSLFLDSKSNKKDKSGFLLILMCEFCRLLIQGGSADEDITAEVGLG